MYFFNLYIGEFWFNKYKYNLGDILILGYFGILLLLLLLLIKVLSIKEFLKSMLDRI